MWYLYQHMDMVRTRLCLYDRYSFPFAQLSQYFSCCLFLFPIKHLPPVLWRKHDMVFAIPPCM